MSKFKPDRETGESEFFVGQATVPASFDPGQGRKTVGAVADPTGES